MTVTALHVIPEFGTGGVELAAEGFAAAPPAGIDFRTFYLASLDLRPGLRRSLVFARNILRLLTRPKPRVMIFSLWRSALLLPLFRLAAPRSRLVLFLHSDRSVHVADRAATRLAAAFAHEVWTDAACNVTRRLPGLACPVRSISYAFPPPPGRRAAPEPRPRFIFWGRVHPDKNLARAVAIFARIRTRAPGASFLIVGPDRGDRATVEQAIARSRVAGAVELAGELGRDEIARLAAESSFFLLTSHLEGASMAIIEAMQLGLVPVTVAVGEIGTYCRDGETAVLIGDDEDRVAEAVCALIAGPARYAAMQEAAIAYWRGRPGYPETMSAAIRAAAGA